MERATRTWRRWGGSLNLILCDSILLVVWLAVNVSVCLFVYGGAIITILSRCSSLSLCSSFVLLFVRSDRATWAFGFLSPLFSRARGSRVVVEARSIESFSPRVSLLSFFPVLSCPVLSCPFCSFLFLSCPFSFFLFLTFPFRAQERASEQSGTARKLVRNRRLLENSFAIVDCSKTRSQSSTARKLVRNRGLLENSFFFLSR